MRPVVAMFGIILSFQEKREVLHTFLSATVMFRLVVSLEAVCCH